MKSKLKQIAISFILMILINLLLSNIVFYELGIENTHIGLLYILGLLFGPYGAFGAMLGNIVVDLMNGYTPIEILPSAIITFAVSYLSYKLWYTGLKTEKITKPRLNTVEHLNLFLFGIIICGLIYSAAHAMLLCIFLEASIFRVYFMQYFLNFTNFAFIFGVLGIWISKKIDFVETPKISKRNINKKFYQAVFCLLMAIVVISSLMLMMHVYRNLLWGLVIIIGILLYIYLTKPFGQEIEPTNENTITKKILLNFIIITVIIAVIGISISILSINYIPHIENVNIYLYLMPIIIITDVVIFLFFVPGIIILRYIENNVIRPLSSFSEIESFIGKNEKIEADGLLDVYSRYTNEKTEIGNLARSYTELINFNNYYIENIREIEGEKERIKAELDIATKIQEANLPTEAIETDEYIVNGYSKPAKEVGGDFFDYYDIDDEHVAIVIGDASGKGVPAAILAMIIQVMIKRLVKYDKNPSKALYQLNNQLCENNPESMFITLWIGIYNKNTNQLIFSNAGHNPPLLKENNKFKYMDIDTGIVIGIIEDFEYVNEEITLTNELILYTDGITDANNNEDEMYGEDRLLNFLNGIESDIDPIDPLLDDIHKFSGNTEQYDDMTLLFLRVK